MYPSLPGASSDAWTLSRPAAGTDSEGNPRKAGEPVQVAAGVGSFGWSTPREAAYAAQQGAAIDGSLTTSAPAETFRTGDLLTVRGTTLRVVKARALRLHTRVALVHATSEQRS